MIKKKQIENLIYEYHWRKKEVDRLENILWGFPSHYRSVGVAQGGIESTLPKPNTNLRSFAELKDMDARELRLYERWKEFSDQVNRIESMADCIEDDQQLIILDCMMEGMSYRSIAAHLGIGRNKVGELKNDMLNQICQKSH